LMGSRLPASAPNVPPMRTAIMLMMVPVMGILLGLGEKRVKNKEYTSCRSL
jgi:hypothetical protein